MLALAAAGGLIAFGACGRAADKGPAPDSSGGAAPAAAFTEADRTEAKRTFETVCFACHGMLGKGDGPGSAALDPKPRDLSDAAWQKGVTDEHIRQVITLGGAAVGKSPVMPAQPQLKGTPKLLAALVAHVRALAKSSAQ